MIRERMGEQDRPGVGASQQQQRYSSNFAYPMQYILHFLVPSVKINLLYNRFYRQQMGQQPMRAQQQQQQQQQPHQQHQQMVNDIGIRIDK